MAVAADLHRNFLIPEQIPSGGMPDNEYDTHIQMLCVYSFVKLL